MKTNKNTILFKKFSILLLVFSFSTIMIAQEDTEKEKKARSSFKVSAGVTVNSLSLDSSNGLESNAAIGYNLGASYKRGRFLYYEVGARFNNRYFNVTDVNEIDKSFSVSAIDIPITGGINITSFVDRLVGLRVFLSAIPSFTIGESVDEGVDEIDDISSFLFYGQGGIGVDIAFFFIEVGYNYGFTNIINDISNESIKSNPGQGYFNIGFRF